MAKRVSRIKPLEDGSANELIPNESIQPQKERLKEDKLPTFFWGSHTILQLEKRFVDMMKPVPAMFPKDEKITLTGIRAARGDKNKGKTELTIEGNITGKKIIFVEG